MHASVLLTAARSPPHTCTHVAHAKVCWRGSPTGPLVQQAQHLIVAVSNAQRAQRLTQLVDVGRVAANAVGEVWPPVKVGDLTHSSKEEAGPAYITVSQLLCTSIIPTEPVPSFGPFCWLTESAAAAGMHTFNICLTCCPQAGLCLV